MEGHKATEKDLNNLFKIAEIALLNTPVGGVIDFEEMLHRSSYGELTPEMERIIKCRVQGHEVFDLGAGDLSLSKKLMSLGAKSVFAIDKEELHDSRKPVDGVTFYEGYFDDFLKENPSFRPKSNAVAFLSWPANHELGGLLELLQGFNTVIYLGCNTGGSSCAWPGFFQQMLLRPVQEHVPYKRNTLIVWGRHDPRLAIQPRLAARRKARVLEEIAGEDICREYRFEEGK